MGKAAIPKRHTASKIFRVLWAIVKQVCKTGILIDDIFLCEREYVCVCVHMCMCVCMHVCVCGCACTQIPHFTRLTSSSNDRSQELDFSTRAWSSPSHHCQWQPLVTSGHFVPTSHICLVTPCPCFPPLPAQHAWVPSPICRTALRPTPPSGSKPLHSQCADPLMAGSFSTTESLSALFTPTPCLSLLTAYRAPPVCSGLHHTP